MENEKAAMLVLAIVAAVAITASGAYAVMGRQATGMGSSYPSTAFRSGIGPSMMGGSVGYSGGMMGAWDGTGSMQQYMWHYWNSTSVP